MPGGTAAICGCSVGAVRLEGWRVTRCSRFCLDLDVTCVVLVLRWPCLLTQAHPQVGNIREVKIHVEGVWSPVVVISEELIHSGVSV